MNNQLNVECMLEKRSASKAPDAQIVIDQTRVIQASDFTWRRGLDTDRTASVGFSRAAHSLHFTLQYLPSRGAVEDTAEMRDPCALRSCWRNILLRPESPVIVLLVIELSVVRLFSFFCALK